MVGLLESKSTTTVNMNHSSRTSPSHKYRHSTLCRQSFNSQFLQVCPPGLHISLGIFLRLFVLLEADCHKLDMTMRIQGGSGGPSFDRYSSALEEQTELKDKQKSLKDGLLLLQQLLTHTLSTAGVSSATNPLILEIVSEIQKTQRKLQDIVSTDTFSTTYTYILHACSKITSTD